MSTQAMTRTNGVHEVTRHSDTKSRVIHPPVDIFTGEDEVLLMADMPGVSKDSLSVKVHDHELTVTGERGESPEGKMLHQGLQGHRFQRTFSLDRNIDIDKIEAKLKEGVLTIHLPKNEAVKSRDIVIKTS